MPTKRYNYFTLIPVNAKDKKAFWDFRLEKIREEYVYYFILNCILWTILLGSYILENNQENLDNLMANSVFIFISVIILLLNSRFKTTLYLLPVLYIIAMTIHVMLSKQHGKELNDEGWSFKKFRQLTYERTLLEGDYYAFIILFSPSFVFCALIYTPIFVVIRWINLDYRYDMSDDK